MKKLLIALALLLCPALAQAQCNGVFPNNTICGNISGAGALPKPVPNSSLTGVPGGSNGQVQFNNAGAFGGLTNVQLTALINPFTAALSGVVPASGGSSTQLFLNQAGGWTAPPAQLRTANPTNLYVSKTGSDSNTCLGPANGVACLTINHAAAQAQLNYDLQGAILTINIAAGVYAEQVSFNNTPGLGGSSQSYFVLKGAGSGTTSINPSTNCGGGVHAVVVSGGAKVGLGSLKLVTSCTGGNDLLIIDNSIAFPIDNDLNFGAATSSLVTAVAGSAFDATYINNQLITISGGSVYAFLISTQSRVVTGAGVTNVITGTPAFSGAFVDAIDGSFYNWGSSSTWSGAATGVRYALALNSYVDSEQITTNLPGNSPGTVGSGSYYYTNGTLTCISGAGGCRVAGAQSGWGAGSTYAVVSGSGDQAGSFSGTAGAGAASTGAIVLVTPSILTGPVDTQGFCVVSLSNLNTSWPTGSTVQSFYSGGAINVTWNSNGSALVNGGVYYFNYVCQ